MGNTINVTTEVSEITVVDETLTVNVTPEEYTIAVGDGPRGFDGDRYHTTSTSTLTIASSGTLTLTTVDKQLDYSTAQTVIVAHDINNHMHGDVVSYNKTSGVLVLDLKHKSGSGTYSSWEVNLDGAVGIQGPQGPTGATGATGAQGPSGVISVSSPITNSGTSTSAVIGFDQSAQNTTNDTRYAQLGAANAFTVGGHTITNTNAAQSLLYLKAAPSQSDAMVWFANSTGTIVGGVLSNGAGRFDNGVRAGTASFLGSLSVAATSSTTIGAVVRGAASQSANLQEWQNSSGTILARVNNAGQLITTDGVFAVGSVTAGNGLAVTSAVSSGGALTLTRATSAAANPGANIGRLYFRDGTNANTLKLVVRAGAAGAETTILDNIPT